MLIRNYRPDGTLFWNETVIQPVRDASGTVTHFIGYHRDASDRLRNQERATAGLPPWLREDRLTGLHSRAYFEELLQRDWMLAQRDSHEIGLTLFDIDNLGAYNETFDKAAGDACSVSLGNSASGPCTRSVTRRSSGICTVASCSSISGRLERPASPGWLSA